MCCIASTIGNVSSGQVDLCLMVEDGLSAGQNRFVSEEFSNLHVWKAFETKEILVRASGAVSVRLLYTEQTLQPLGPSSHIQDEVWLLSWTFTFFPQHSTFQAGMTERSVGERQLLALNWATRSSPTDTDDRPVLWGPYNYPSRLCCIPTYVSPVLPGVLWGDLGVLVEYPLVQIQSSRAF